MKNLYQLRKAVFIAFVLSILTVTVSAQPANDQCSNAVTLTPSNGTCNSVAGTLRLSGVSATSTGSINAFCGVSGSPDVWYKFQAQSAFPTVTLSNMGTSMQANARLQLFNVNNCAAATLNTNSNACVTTAGSGNTTLSLVPTTALTVGTTYLVRVFTGTTNVSGTSSNWNFDICITNPPDNDNCANATYIPLGGNSDGTLYGATTQSTTGSCGSGRKDVWYRFDVPEYIAGMGSPVIVNVSLNSGNTSLSTSNTYIELFSAIGNTTNCSSTTSVSGGCQNVSASRTFNSLSAGTYYIRVNTSVTNILPGSSFNISVTAPAASRMKEVFRRTVLSGASAMNNPWEVTYGADGYLWVTESKGYKVQRIHPSTGAKTEVLNISQNSTFLPMADRTFNCQFSNGSGAQGGLAGLALHPKFMDPVSPQNYVYISYVHTSLGSGGTGWGNKFVNRLVRFTYNTGTNKLESPVSICDTLPGSNDHNSQRIIIAPVEPNGTPFLFYASGDMGAGQGNNYNRPILAQNPESYEGKILRFNLEPDGDAGALDKWIPGDNPYNDYLGKQSAVWAIGMRNNQGFAYDSTTHILYGTSHGPYSDDELNIIEGFKNYGHPLVIGYHADGNYNGTMYPISSTSYSAGSPYGSYGGFSRTGVSTCPPIGNETTRMEEINAMGLGDYKDPLFSAYAFNIAGQPNVNEIWSKSPNTPGNNVWPSEGWSGLDIYTKSNIPGWHRSLVAAGLKWGRLLRLKLGDDGRRTLPSNLPENNTSDTITYLQSSNRYRDLAFDPNGRDIYIVMDNGASSVATDGNPPAAPACQGCLVKYTFLGYGDEGGKSAIPTTVSIAPGKSNVCDSVNTVTINAANYNNELWVPLTDTLSNIVAEINAMGQNLGRVSAKLYHNANAVRNKSGRKYLDRNITITPEFQPSGPVKIRLYLTQSEYAALAGSPGSAVDSPDDLRILKNSDGCGSALNENPESVTLDYPMEAFGSDGYVLQATINSFSSFYFGSDALTTLPLELITFKGSLFNNAALIQWQTINESNVSHFELERSLDGVSFSKIVNVKAVGNSQVPNNYSHTDFEINQLAGTVVHYRLKMIDIDGRYNYSSIVTIQLGDITNRVIISPNPTTGDTRLMIASAKGGRAEWKLTDNSGRVVLRQSVTLNKGNNNLTLNVAGLRSGMYYLHISGAGIDQMLKLQKL